MSAYQKRAPLARVAQGDIYRDILVPYSAMAVEGEDIEELEVTEINYNYSVVLTQECDLEQDFANREKAQEKQDKFLPSILFAPAYLAEGLRKGTHLEEIGLKMENINSDRWKVVKQNNNLRYHFLETEPNYGVPDLVIDFKHYFTISRDFFYRRIFNDQNYVASLGLLFREDLSNRFSHYLSRIGLPGAEKSASNPAG